jgi:tetratricopeptide (TPR) repeat protein
VPSSPLDVSLTASGVVVGTPAYMAPEQLLGDPADASSDQFSFCVALYEALCGTRPFKGDNTDALRAAIVRHELQRPKRSVSPWLMRIVERGLAAAPAERWPSMQALIAALRRDPALVRRRWLAVGGVACLLVASGVVQRIASRHEATRCQNQEQRLLGIWDAPRRQAVRSALGASTLPFAAALADDVTRRLDRYARDWVEARVRVCEATRKRGEQSEALLDLRMQCLDERIDEVRALGDAIVGGRGAALEHAGDAARALSSYEDCPRLTSAGAASLPIDPAARATLASLRRRADDAATADRMVNLDDALRRTTELTSDPQLASFPTLQAEVLLVRGRVLQQLDRIDEAQRSMTDAIAPAIRARDDRRLALISLSYAMLAGTRQSRLDEALAWARVGEALSARLGKPDALEERRLYTLAAIEDSNGQLAPAEEAARAALALAKKMFPPGDVALAERLNGLANVLGDEGRDAEAAALYEESLALLDASGLGQTNDAADRLYNLALTYDSMGRYADVERATRRALHIKETILGLNDFALMGSLHELGGAIANQGRPDEAEPILRRALALAEQRPDEDPAAPADIVAMLGTVEEQRGHFDAAIKLYEKALAKQPVEVARGEARFDLARVLWKTGRDRTRAVALARQARNELTTRPVALRNLDQWLNEHRL